MIAWISPLFAINNTVVIVPNILCMRFTCST